MQLKQLLGDDDAVSPVIGVILMVAITVILAAVVATFVLSLGEQVDTTAPNANFQFEYDEASAGDAGEEDSWGIDGDAGLDGGGADGLLTITHTAGPTIETSRLGATGSDASLDESTADAGTVDYADWSTATDPALDEMRAGDSIRIWVTSTDSITVTWESDGESAALGFYDAPDA